MTAPASQIDSAPQYTSCWLPAPYRQTLAYRTQGNGRPVVLLHGLWNSSGLWQPTMDHLSQHYRLYAPDLPAHGQTPPRLPWKLREVAALLASWIRSLALPPATVIGHSMDGALAIMLAAAEPGLVNRLVLVNAAGLPMQQPFLRALVRTGLNLTDRQTTRYNARYGSPNRLQSLAIWQATHEVLTCDVRPDLKAVRCPTLIVWGMRDPLLPVESAVALQRAIPGAELALLPNVRHQVPRHAPAILHTMLDDFLARRDTRQAETTAAD
jgi:pimeloyl-ACP methyl ester carboxylesterase